MIIALPEIERHFSQGLIEAGRRLVETGAVSSADIHRGGELITAIVSPGTGRPVRVYVRLSRDDGGPAIHGECGCGADGSCSHVVAALLHGAGVKSSGNTGIGAGESAVTGHDRWPLGNEQRRQCLLYIFHLDPQGLSVESRVARRLDQGGYELIGRFDPARAKGAMPARFLDPIDLELLPILERALPDPATARPGLNGEDSSGLFERIVSTGRSYFESTEAGGPLRRGEPRSILFSWRLDRYGRQWPAWQITPPASQLLPLSEPWYLDRESACCAPLLSDLSVECVKELLTLPGLEPAQVERWYTGFRQRHPGVSIPAPQRLARRRLPAAPPVPSLYLTRTGKEERHHACLTFDYGGVEFSPDAPNTQLHEGELIEIERDNRAEQAAMVRLCELGLERWTSDDVEEACFVTTAVFPQTEQQAWIDFQLQAIPLLRAQGWRVGFDGFSHRLVEGERWHCDTLPLERIDWFALSLHVEVEGRRVELLPLLLKLLESLPPACRDLEGLVGHHLLLPLADIDGNPCLLRLDGERASQILALLLDVCGSRPAGDRPIEINRAQLARLASLDSEATAGCAPMHWQDEESRQLADRLRNLDRIPACAPPASLRASLRPYQQEGLEWLQFLREFRLAGILADDMGLGKTLQTLSHLLLEKEAGRADRPSLVVVPTSLVFNWLHEAKRFAPALKVLLLHGAQRKRRFTAIPDYDLVVTTYPLLTRDSEVLGAQAYHLLILDEAQTIKNPRSRAGRIVRRLEARHRLCLTGTPLENHLGELWSLFDFLMPGLLGDDKGFRREFRLPIESRNDPAAAVRLSRRLRPFLLRRTKQQVAGELPEKSEFVQSVVLEGAQRELYETVRLSMHRRVREEIERQGLARSRILVLDALMKLRQVCCDPRLLKNIDVAERPESAKLAHLMAMLREMVEEGRRILLFSQFTAMLALIEAEVERAGIDYVKLTGRTRDRETPVKRFQQGRVPLFLISLKAGGVGLNLTAADTVIHYDPWWNPAVERQATDRSHRIGQTQKVFVYKLICEGTLEEKILAMQQRKQRLADGLYQADDDQESQWDEQDIEALFGPLGDGEAI
jgi:superfamily II DNA or RNA helicase